MLFLDEYAVLILSVSFYYMVKIKLNFYSYCIYQYDGKLEFQITGKIERLCKIIRFKNYVYYLNS